MKKPPLEILVTLLLFAVLSTIALTTSTTGDNGDSILHYLYSRGAFHYPSFFLHHWAKPLFVLLSAPFAQFGFKGIEIFNCLCASLMALLSFYTARRLNLRYPYLVFILLFFAPFCFKLIFSGLTEFLFALIVIAGVYYSTRKKYITAALLISFLPMVRSEGLLIIGAFLIYFLFHKNFKAAVFLLFGQLAYSIAGAFYYKDLLWVFTKIPYANMGSPYGQGKVLDLVHRLNYVIEKPIYVLLLIGSFALIYKTVKLRFKNRGDAQLLLVLGTFIVFFVAHSIFWWRGIFNSMGLPRVFVSIMPLIALIALYGVQVITDRIQTPAYKKSALGFIIAIICIYPFSYRPQGLVYNKELLAVPGNKFIDESVVPYIKNEFPDYHTRRLYYNAPYISLALNIDHFDESRHKDLHHILYDAAIPHNALLIWDSWFSVNESGMSLMDMENNPKFELIKQLDDTKNTTLTRYAIFKVKNN